VWVQADVWLKKAVTVGRRRKGLIVPHGGHTTLAALVEFTGIFLPPSFYQDVKIKVLVAWSTASRAWPMPSWVWQNYANQITHIDRCSPLGMQVPK
jgi:hypothetical protein